MGQKPGKMGQKPGKMGQKSGKMGQKPGKMGQKPGKMGQKPGKMGQKPGKIGQKPGKMAISLCTSNNDETNLSRPAHMKQMRICKCVYYFNTTYTRYSFLIRSPPTLLLDDTEYEPHEPRYEKTGLRGFRPGPTQTGLYSHRRWLEAGNFVFRK